MITEESVYKIGQITRTHGTQGEVSFTFTDDVWDRRDASFLILSVDGILVPFFLESYRFRNDEQALLKFVDYNTSDRAQELCGCEVYFPFSQSVAPEEGSYTWKYFTGFKVTDKTLGYLGIVDEVEDQTQNVLFSITGKYIPVAEELIVEVNHEERMLLMDLPSGILDL